MTQRIVVTAKMNADTLYAKLQKGDTELFEIDFKPWQSDNDNLVAVSWTVESGSATISGQSLTSGVASALVAAAEYGTTIISITATTATRTKKVRLQITARKPPHYMGDYNG